MFSPYNPIVIRSVTLAHCSWRKKLLILVLWRVVHPLKETLGQLRYLFDES